MDNRGVVVALIAAGVGGYIGINAYREVSAKIQGLETEVSELKKEVAEAHKSGDLSLQERCARQAKTAFTDMGYGKDGLSSYVNHYSPKLGKCFMSIDDTSSQNGATLQSKTLMDAFEGRVYGTFLWRNSQNSGKNFWEVAPFQCQVQINGKETACQSAIEFENLATSYLE